MRRNGRMAGSRAGKLMALAALAGLCVAASMPATAGLETDTVTASNWVRQTSSTQGTNYFMGPVSIGGQESYQRLTLPSDGGIVAAGSLGTSSGLGGYGAGSWFIWYPRLGSMRAGIVDSAWDSIWCDGNTGTGSVAFGRANWADSSYSAIGGGSDNAVIGEMGVIAGGYYSFVEAYGGAIGGGEGNLTQGTHASIPGGYYNEANGDYSFAAGYMALANHFGTFVWSDMSAGSFGSTTNNQFLIRAAGGVGIGTNNPSAMLHVAGTAKFESGVTYIPPLGNLSMGSFTNMP